MLLETYYFTWITFNQVFIFGEKIIGAKQIKFLDYYHYKTYICFLTTYSYKQSASS